MFTDVYQVQQQSVNRAIYFQIVVDEATRYKWIFFMQTMKIEEFIILIQNERQKIMKILITAGAVNIVID